jgi:hypothetical protein
MPTTEGENGKINLSIDYQGGIQLECYGSGPNFQIIDHKRFATPGDVDGYIKDMLEKYTKPTVSVDFTDSAKSFLESQEPEYCSKTIEKLREAAGRARNPASGG